MRKKILNLPASKIANVHRSVLKDRKSENQTNAGREMKIANNADNAGGKIKNDRETRLGHKTEYMTEKETAGVAN